MFGGQLEDMELDAESERAAVEIAAQGVIGKRVDEMESGFMMAIDYMIQIADKDNDDKVPDRMHSSAPFHFVLITCMWSISIFFKV